MAHYITRVELHEPTTALDYATLHAAMEQRGFTRTIRGDDGVNYHLPMAEYSFVGLRTIDQVLQLALAAARATNRSHAVLVTEANATRWYGLKRA